MSDAFLEELREKSGETDLDSILKSTIGGYTKQSVLEYLFTIKKQQQSLKEAYEAELQSAMSEREKAAIELGGMIGKMQALENEKKRLSEALSKLKIDHTSLEEDMKEALARIAEDECLIEKLKQELSDSREYNTLIQEMRLGGDPSSQGTAGSAPGERAYPDDSFYAEKEEKLEENELLQIENEELRGRLSEQVEECMKLSLENSRLKAANTIIRRKLDAQKNGARPEALREVI